MTELDRRFHETWLGMVQPVEGLVVSIPVLVDAQCMERLPPHAQSKLLELCPPRRSSDAGDEQHTLGSLERLLAELLGHAPGAFDSGPALPDALSLWVPEGRQTLRPTLALRKLVAPAPSESADATPASRAGSGYEMLVWQLPTGLALDKPETVTGSWDYPPAAKFDRLLRQCRVPLGLLTNDEALRLVYAPHGESSGSITFRLDDMASVGGRPILDAFVMLLSANRFFGVEESRALPAILAESRKRQANVTNELASQVFDALQRLLAGFQAAAERDGRDLLDDALAREHDHLYKGLLTVLLRLVFVLYAEDRGLLPVDHPLYARHFSVLALFEQLQRDRDAWPDSMPRRFGAWGRLVALFRAVYLGVDHQGFHMPPRRGELFDPHRFPFLEGWGPAGSAPVAQADARAAVRVPTVDDDTVFRVLEKLLLFEGQRLSYRALDVEQLGSVYEGLMGYHVVRMSADAVCMRPDRVWVTADELLAVAPAQRAKWLKEVVGLSAAQAEKILAASSAARGSGQILTTGSEARGSGQILTPREARGSGQILTTGSEARGSGQILTPQPPLPKGRGGARSRADSEATASEIAASTPFSSPLSLQGEGGRGGEDLPGAPRHTRGEDLPGAPRHTRGEDLPPSDPRAAVLSALAQFAMHSRGADPALARARAGQLVLQPGSERRRTSSHYTPRSLSEPIVRRTLEPLLAVMGEAPPSAQILALKVCDPAMGSGAFLVEACRFLAGHLVAAWTREGSLEAHSRVHGEPLLYARRLVAQRCLYGVDKNPQAVELARLSLWLVTLARELPFTFVDHSLRHGDSLVGLDFAQLRSFHWKPGAQQELFGREVTDALDEALALRQRILALAEREEAVDPREREQLLWDAEDAMQRVRLVADLVVGAFFSAEKDKEREKERVRRLGLASAWLRSGESPSEELLGLQAALRERVPAFHWGVEFPEIFYSERPDPLDEMRTNGAADMDAFVGNPPFMGGSKVSGALGIYYPDWLKVLNPVAEGRGDLSAHFFWRALSLLGANGTAGLIATNSIAQGDTRETALVPIIKAGGVIYDATSSLPWPGDANVIVSVVHFAVGAASRLDHLRYVLDGVEVATISSFLRTEAERTPASPLNLNSSCCYQGNKINGAGFVLTPEERHGLIAQDKKNGSLIFPYLGGEEVNTDPVQGFHRYVINFGARTLAQAENWPEVLQRIRLLVKPARDAVQDNTGKGGHGKKYWWQFLDRCDPLMEAVAPLTRCLAISIVTKHLAFSWQPKDRVLSNALFVFALDRATQFAILQSRIHERWARLLSSSLEDRLRYTATDCFETFPFPQPDPRTVIPALEALGEALYTARADYMLAEQVGLTITYNRLKDPSHSEPRIDALRAQHEALDRAVLAAYGWDELAPLVPPFCIASDEDKRALARFESEVLERLFALNAKRAEQERITGLGAAKAKPAKKPAKGKAAVAAQPALSLGEGEGEGGEKA